MEDCAASYFGRVSMIGIKAFAANDLKRKKRPPHWPDQKQRGQHGKSNTSAITKGETASPPVDGFGPINSLRTLAHNTYRHPPGKHRG